MKRNDLWVGGLIAALFCVVLVVLLFRPQPARVVVQGVIYQFDASSETITTGADGSVTFLAGKHILIEQNGRVSVDGRLCGAVMTGNHVLLTQDGRVWVNGRPREAKP